MKDPKEIVFPMSALPQAGAGYSGLTTPTVDFIADNLEPDVDESIQFLDLSGNLPTQWLWQYNSGSGWVTFGTSQNPIFAFSESGTYSIRLTATNANGSGTATKQDYIEVQSSGIAAPTNLAAVVGRVQPDGNPTCTLTCDAAVGATGYLFEGSVNGGSTWSPTDPEVTVDPTFTDDGSVCFEANNANIRYRVKATNGVLTSSPSNVAFAALLTQVDSPASWTSPGVGLAAEVVVLASASNGSGGVGGGGGALSSKSFTTVSGDYQGNLASHDYPGQISTFLNPSSVTICSAQTGQADGTGGQASSGTGDTKHSGGNGSAGGGGGGAAGKTGDGANASGASGGAAGTGGTLSGAAGNDGVAGSEFGGGGGDGEAGAGGSIAIQGIIPA